jgi:hypothetical protein
MTLTKLNFKKYDKNHETTKAIIRIIQTVLCAWTKTFFIISILITRSIISSSMDSSS